jgi:hypothetical protein
MLPVVSAGSQEVKVGVLDKMRRRLSLVLHSTRDTCSSHNLVARGPHGGHTLLHTGSNIEQEFPTVHRIPHPYDPLLALNIIKRLILHREYLS